MDARRVAYIDLFYSLALEVADDRPNYCRVGGNGQLLLGVTEDIGFEQDSLISYIRHSG